MKTSHQIHRLFIFTLALAALAGCTKVKLAFTDFHSARKQWEKLNALDYSYQYYRAPVFGYHLFVRVVIHDGLVADVIDPFSLETIMSGDTLHPQTLLQAEPYLFKTIDEWFDQIQNDYRSSHLNVEYDEEMGFPKMIHQGDPTGGDSDLMEIITNLTLD